MIILCVTGRIRVTFIIFIVRPYIILLNKLSSAYTEGIPTNEKAPNASNTAAVKAVLLLTV